MNSTTRRLLAADAATVALSAALLLGGVLAWRMHWTSDDAFVSFRCARNLVRGEGLTFNAGESVESYTNFLWTLLVAAGLRAGWDPIRLTRMLGVCALLATTLILARAELRGVRGPRRRMPVAASAWALCGHAQGFAVSGLETILFTALATAALAAMVEARRAPGFLLAGLLTALAALTRPDGALLAVPGAWLAARASFARRSPHPLLAGALPVLALHLPYAAWKLDTYGSLLPNTFYAKAAAVPYPGQGALYVGLFLACYWALAPCALLAVAQLARGLRGPASDPGWEGARAEGVLSGFACLYLGYVVWVGGDFMFARFCIPAVPALLLLGSRALARLRHAPLHVAGALALIAGSARPRMPDALREGPGIAGIVEESRFGTPEALRARRELAGVLAAVTHGSGVRLLIGGGMMSFAWWGDFPYVIDSYGLTDAGIAHRPLGARGRVGHEKELGVFSPYYAARAIDLAVPTERLPMPPPGDPLAEVRAVTVRVPADHVGAYLHPGDAIPLLLLCHHDEVLSNLAGRGVELPRFAAWLDAFIAQLPALERGDALARALALRSFYFAHVDDRPRREAIEAYLGVDPGTGAAQDTGR